MPDGLSNSKTHHMNDIITTYAEQISSDSSDNLLFRYYPNLPEGSMVQVGVSSGDLENYKTDDCYEFLVDFFGEKKKLYLEEKTTLGHDDEHNVDLYEFMLRGIEDVEPAEKQV